MVGDGFAEEFFVFDLDAGHIKQVLDAVIHAEFGRKLGGIFVFDRVLALEASGEIHRHEPARQKTRRAERAPDRPEYFLSEGSGPGIELCQPLADTPAVIPFLGLDLFDPCFFNRIF